MAQESIDIANDSITKDSTGVFDATNAKIKNVVDPTAAQEVATKNYVDTASDSKVAEAAASATSAAASAITAGQNAGTQYVDTFNGTGSQTAFTLSATPTTENNTLVTISGVVQHKSSYSLSGSTLTFSSAPAAGTGNIEVVHLSLLPTTERDLSSALANGNGTGGYDIAVGANDDITLVDGATIKWGTSGDGLSIYHNGSHSYITETGTGTGNLYINATDLYFGNQGYSKTYAAFTGGDGDESKVRLYYNSSTRIETTNGGARIYGDLQVDGGDIELGSGNDTTISRSSAGVVTIEGQTVRTGTVGIADGGTGATTANAAASALGVGTEDSPSFSGMTLTGDMTLTGASNNVVFDASDNSLEFAANAKAKFNDAFEIFHDGSNTRLHDTGTGNLLIQSNGAGIYLQKDASESLASFGVDGAVTLFNNDSPKLDTIAAGVNIHGKVGVNIANPLYTATVAGADGATNMMLQSTAGLHRLAFYNDSSQQRISTYNSTALTFAITESEKMRLDNGGRFLINKSTTQTANAPLQVASTLGTGQIFVGNGSGTGYMFGRDNVTTGNFLLGELANDSDTSVTNLLTISTGTGNATFAGNVTATGTIEPAGDTAAGDNAAIGYTSAEGLILTGQGSTSDVTLKNDADETVFSVPTGSTNIQFGDASDANTTTGRAVFGADADASVRHNGSNFYLYNGTGNTLAYSDTFQFFSTTGSEVFCRLNHNAAVELFYDNEKKISTTTSGVHITSTAPTIKLEDTENSLSGYINGDNGNVLIQSHNVNRDIIFGENAASAEIMRVTGLGNVGIGTSTPGAELEVAGDYQPLIVNSTNSSAQKIILEDNGTTRGYLGGTSSTPVSFYDASATLIGAFDSSGNFKVQPTSATQTIKVQSSNGNAEMEMRVNDGMLATVGSTNSVPTAIQAGGSEAIRVLTDGKVGIGTTSANQLLHVNSSGGANINLTSGSGYLSQILLGTTANPNHGRIQYNAGTGHMTWCTNDSSTAKMELDDAGALSITGALSKGSGSFKIDHPLPAKKDTHHLVHSFVEGPQADLIYRGRATLVAGEVSVDIDDAAGMTSGTFEVLCRDIQAFTSNETGWTAVRGSVSGATLTIEAQDNTCTDTISWMVVGERKDPHMFDTDWTDDDGKVIVEPLKPSEEE